MIALYSCLATLTVFNTRKLFQFTVKLFNLPTDGILLLNIISLISS